MSRPTLKGECVYCEGVLPTHEVGCPLVEANKTEYPGCYRCWEHEERCDYCKAETEGT